MSRDLFERDRDAQIVETERYRNDFEEMPRSQQADKLGTRVYRSGTKVGAVTVVRNVTAQQWRESARVPLSILVTRVPNASAQ